MSAELLREAAAKMRERAEAATPGPWVVSEVDGLPIVFDTDPLPEPVVYDQELTPANAEHIASWHPAVAIAVADWLDAMADHIDVWTKDYEPGEIRHCDVGTPADSNCVDAALTVARAYLGGDA